MSALILHRIPKGSAMSNTCELDDCNRMGRYRVEIAGRPMLSEHSLGAPGQAQLCDGCGRQWRKLWRELNGDVVEQDARDALQAFAGTRVQGIEAIDTLRTLGYPHDLVLDARAKVREGQPLEQVLEGLLGGATLEVAA